MTPMDPMGPIGSQVVSAAGRCDVGAQDTVAVSQQESETERCHRSWRARQ